MTEKRFKVYSDSYSADIVDGDTNRNYNQMTDIDDLCDLLNELHEENQLLKQRLAEQNDVEWLRNNTVWEMMPSNRRTYISTIYHKRNDE